MNSINKFGSIARDPAYYYYENEEDGADALHLSSTDPDAYDAAGKRIAGLSEPKDPHDAATLTYLESRLFDMDRDSQNYVSKYFVEKDDYDSHVYIANKNLTDSRKEIEDCANKLSALQPKVESVAKSSNDLKKIVEDCKRKINAFDPKLSSALKSVNDLKARVDENKRAIGAFDEKVQSSLRANSDRISDEFDAIKRQLKTHEEKLNDKQEQIDHNIEGEIGRNNEIFRRLQNLDDACSNFTIKFLADESRLDDLERRIERLEKPLVVE